MRVPPIVALITLAFAAPSLGAMRPVVITAGTMDTTSPIAVRLKAPDGLAAAGRPIRFTIRQQRHDASCVSVASVTVRPGRGRMGARATLRPGRNRRWCSGAGQAEARVLDRYGAQRGSPIIEPINVGPADDETLPVRVSVLDGSTVDGAPVSGELSGVVAGKVSLASATTVDALTGSLGGCAVAPQSALVLMADGVVFATMHLDCAGSIVLAGRVGDGGLNSVALDRFPRLGRGSPRAEGGLQQQLAQHAGRPRIVAQAEGPVGLLALVVDEHPHERV